LQLKPTNSATATKAALGWRLECLLLPEVEPGNAVVVESPEVTGQFKVINVQHVGELMGPTCRTFLEVADYV
jgi:hypothetical protein